LQAAIRYQWHEQKVVIGEPADDTQSDTKSLLQHLLQVVLIFM